MNPRLIFLLALVVRAGGALAAETKAGLASASPVAAPVPVRATGSTVVAAAPRNDSSIAPSAPFDGFRIVVDRNIFNPNRTGRRERTTEEVAPPRLDSIALVGTIDSDKGLRAIFDVSIPRTKSSQAVHAGESVDKFKVTKITPKAIDVERDGKTVPMSVGQQFRRPPGGDWDLVGEDVVRREAQDLAASEAKTDPMAPVVIPANVDAATRALMEKRNKSLQTK